MTANISILNPPMREEYWYDDVTLLFSDWSIPNLNGQADCQVTGDEQYVLHWLICLILGHFLYSLTLTTALVIINSTRQTQLLIG